MTQVKVLQSYSTNTPPNRSIIPGATGIKVVLKCGDLHFS